MKISLILSIFMSNILLLSGCDKPSSQNTKNSSVGSVPVVAEVKVDPIVFESDNKFASALGQFGQEDSLLKKKLATSVGKPIQITKMYVWARDDSEWEKGGKLHLRTDDSMGVQYGITCSISSENGDKFMVDRKRRVIEASGIIKEYSSSYGLRIDPCNATWKD